MTVLAVLTAIGFFKVFGPEIDGVRDGTFPFAGAKQLLIVEMFAIGLPSIFLAVQSNNSPVKGNFLKNALKSATPGAVGVVFSLMAIIQAVGFFFGQGSGSYVSRQLGIHNTQEAEKMVSL